ncbi:class I SAM-dependent methyltransferase [Pseudoalteromonas sp. SG44-1]|uniref:class I SAM-dependent methyltransferase n=1 Tax=Pseudoalteromonas sp. SG44-1 TaxID=2760964 RepID=UPI0016031B37|nr:class I SAM-dependent methyltransferase [Pseudoalteromonas sp. SG44-1]MBB1419653.1 class I SAM-dependent methyltransferase [Pseudoalteromonas sp. SG44-1]
MSYNELNNGVYMNYYHEVNNAKAYTEMCDGFNAAEQLHMLSKVLSPEDSVLELGSGPGNDLEILAQKFRVTGSDYSPAFVNTLNKRLPDVLSLILDAVKIETEARYNAVYSNKVMHHLSDTELRQSFRRQAELLLPGGFVFHLVWQKIQAPETTHGLLFHPRSLAKMKEAMGQEFNVVESKVFSEFEDGDSLAILARKVFQS